MITERMARIVWLHRNTTQPMIACRVLVQQQELQAAAAPSESLHGCANKHTLLRDCTVLLPHHTTPMFAAPSCAGACV